MLHNSNRKTVVWFQQQSQKPSYEWQESDNCIFCALFELNWNNGSEKLLSLSNNSFVCSCLKHFQTMVLENCCLNMKSVQHYILNTVVWLHLIDNGFLLIVKTGIKQYFFFLNLGTVVWSFRATLFLQSVVWSVLSDSRFGVVSIIVIQSQKQNISLYHILLYTRMKPLYTCYTET